MAPIPWGDWAPATSRPPFSSWLHRGRLDHRHDLVVDGGLTACHEGAAGEKAAGGLRGTSGMPELPEVGPWSGLREPLRAGPSWRQLGWPRTLAAQGRRRLPDRRAAHKSVGRRGKYVVASTRAISSPEEAGSRSPRHEPSTSTCGPSDLDDGNCASDAQVQRVYPSNPPERGRRPARALAEDLTLDDFASCWRGGPRLKSLLLNQSFLAGLTLCRRDAYRRAPSCAGRLPIGGAGAVPGRRTSGGSHRRPGRRSAMVSTSTPKGRPAGTRTTWPCIIGRASPAPAARRPSRGWSSAAGRRTFAPRANRMVGARRTGHGVPHDCQWKAGGSSWTLNCSN